MLSTRSKCLCRMCKRIPFGWPEKRYGTNPIPGIIHGGEQPMGGTHAHCIKYVVCINQKKQPLQIVQRNFNSVFFVEMLQCQVVGKFKHRLFSPFVTPAWHSHRVIPTLCVSFPRAPDRRTCPCFHMRFQPCLGKINGNMLIAETERPLQQVLTIHGQQRRQETCTDPRLNQIGMKYAYMHRYICLTLFDLIQSEIDENGSDFVWPSTRAGPLSTSLLID